MEACLVGVSLSWLDSGQEYFGYTGTYIFGM